MKKINNRIYVTLISVLMAAALTACSSSAPAENNAKPATENTQQVQNETAAPAATETQETTAPVESEATSSSSKTSSKFYFMYENVKIVPNTLMQPLETALGSDYKYYESPSCAYIGLDKVYVYNGFTIYTYPDDNAVDHVLEVLLTDDTLSTPEDVRLGDTAEKVTETYGSDYTDLGGAYVYNRGNTSLQFLIKDDRIASIQYWFIDENTQQ